MWMSIEVYPEIEQVQYMFQGYLQDYIKYCFSDMDLTLQRVDYVYTWALCDSWSDPHVDWVLDNQIIIVLRGMSCLED